MRMLCEVLEAANPVKLDSLFSRLPEIILEYNVVLVTNDMNAFVLGNILKTQLHNLIIKTFSFESQCNFGQ